MKIDVLTLFPGMVEPPLRQSLLGKAWESGKIDIAVHDLRRFAAGRHKTADDAPYGGGEGMVMKPEPLLLALDELRTAGSTVFLLSPQGTTFTQKVAERLAALSHLVFICGHYEGIDDRIRQTAVDEELSLGDFVAGGGELPVLVMIDVICRLLPGVVGNRQSLVNETFSSGLLDYPAYTRPPEFRGLTVPEVLLSGHHARIERWRRKESLRRTLVFRPDLLERFQCDPTDRILLHEIMEELTAICNRLNE